MKKLSKLTVVLLALVISVTCFGCENDNAHVHTYREVAATEATCEKNGNVLYYECDCGKVFIKDGDGYTETDLGDLTIPSYGHTFTNSVKEVEATCAKNGVKEHAYCTLCKKLFLKTGAGYAPATEADLVIAKKAHVYDREVVSDEYRLSEATAESPQVFVKSCVCGMADETNAYTFTFGKTLVEYTSENASLYEPHALSLSLYDTKNCVYGFTWNADKVSSRPVVEIKETGKEDTLLTVGAMFDEKSSYEKTTNGDKAVSVNYIRAHVKLNANAEYEYRAGDKYLNRYTDYVTFTTVNPADTGTWSFAHVSDSQTVGNENLGGKDSETFYANTLKGISSNSLNRFILHTGDVVEWSRYESYWRYMIDGNFGYFAGIPTMAVSGNHDTTYKSGTGSGETLKHFNYSIPEQSTGYGFYYSYSYGGVKFIMVNTNDLTSDSKLKADQLKWLENELKNKTERWTIVALHNPLYSPGKWGSGPSNTIALNLTAQLSDLFAKYKVDVVLQGHDHMISKTNPIGKNGLAVRCNTEKIDGVTYSVNPQGVIYVMNGPAGNQSRSVVYEHDESIYDYAEGSNVCSWAEFEINGDLITVYVKNASSGTAVTQKTWGIKKTA